MSPYCSFLEFLGYVLEKSSKFGIFSAQNETEIMFFQGPFGIIGLISSVWDVFNRNQSYLEPGNPKSSFFGYFKFRANFALSFEIYIYKLSKLDILPQQFFFLCFSYPSFPKSDILVWHIFHIAMKVRGQ